MTRNQTPQIREIAVEEVHIVDDAEPAQPCTVNFGSAGTPNEAVDLITFLEQELGQVGTVLPCDAGDERPCRHNSNTPVVYRQWPGCINRTWHPYTHSVTGSKGRLGDDPSSATSEVAPRGGIVFGGG